MNTVVCPWFSRCDMMRVSHKLFDGDWKAKNEALEEMNVWIARCYPRVPLGIEVTSTLIRALALTERLADTKEMELIFCMALVRFVNLLTEIGQVMDYPLPVRSLARKMGVPEWLVDLRNSASHSTLPSFSVLKTAVKSSLDWLKKHYWSAENAVVKDVFSAPFQDELGNLYKILIDSHLKLIQAFEAPQSHVLDFEIQQQALLKTSAFAKVMVTDGLILPTAHQILSAGLDSEDAVTDYQVKLWKPFLDFLDCSNLLIHLTDGLIVEAVSRPSMKGQIATSLIAVFLKKFNLVRGPCSKKLYQYLCARFLKMKYNQLQIVIDFFPKDKQKSLLMLAAKRSLCNPKYFRNMCDDVVEAGNFRKTVTAVEHCPVGMLPVQFGVQKLNLKLPSHVDEDDQIHDTHLKRPNHRDVGLLHKQNWSSKKKSSLYLL